MSYTERPSEEFISVLRKCGDSDMEVALAAQREFAKALELPLRKGVLIGNILVLWVFGQVALQTNLIIKRHHQTPKIN